MFRAIRRLSLGITLIVCASAILLFADRGRRTGVVSVRPRIAILQHANTPVLDEGVRGVIEGLAERGYKDGERITLEMFNAQGDMPTGVAIARQITAGDYSLVITTSTPSMQAVANNNREGRTRHLFTVVADPFAAGIGLDRADPSKHPPHMVGQGSLPPVDLSFTLARQMLPTLTRVGVAWNPSESNSRALVERARTVAGGMGVTLLEANADTSSAVGEAIDALVARDAQAIWIGGDNTVIAAVNTVIANAQRARIPVFTVLPGAPDRGTLFDVGPDFYAVGRQGGLLAADILEGADMARIPVRDVLDIVPPFLSVNTTAVKGLKDMWQTPADLLASANVIVDATGVHRQTPASGPRATPATAAAGSSAGASAASQAASQTAARRETQAASPQAASPSASSTTRQDAPPAAAATASPGAR